MLFWANYKLVIIRKKVKVRNGGLSAEVGALVVSGSRYEVVKSRFSEAPAS